MDKDKMAFIPYVYERDGAGKGDLFSRMLDDRIVFLTGPIDSEMAELVIAQLLYLESRDPAKDITLYINSPGGSVSDGMAIHDTMQYIRSDVQTICVGSACSMAAFLLAAGTKGKRFCLQNSEVMIHQVLSGYQGQATDLEIHTRHTLRIKERMNRLLSKYTGQSYEKICLDTERDYFMNAEEALEYGLIDKIFEHRE